ncbi:acyltransferase [Vibrio harveyi]|uniref:acyltransferase n=1 Tax=Vibrio harveyi TaxID=669 RepID=UPI004067746E
MNNIIYKAIRLTIYKITTIKGNCKFFIYKYVLGLNIVCDDLWNVNINSGTYFRINNGTLKFNGSFHARRYLTINISNGTVVLGNGVFFNQGVSINCRNAVIIGNNTILGENVKIYDHNHRFRDKEIIKKQGFKTKEVDIGENVWIGSNVVILSGVKIGDNSVISAGSIIKENVPSDVIYQNGCYVEIKRSN